MTIERCLWGIAAAAPVLLLWPTLPNVYYFCLAATLMSVVALRWSWAWLLVAMLLMMAWSIQQAQTYLAARPPAALENTAFRVHVQIQGLAEQSEFGWRCRVKPIKLLSKVDYPHWQDSEWLITTPSRHEPKANQIWQMTVSLKKPHGLASAGSFDYQQWLLGEQIHAVGRASRAIYIQEGAWTMNDWRWRIRQQAQVLARHAPEAGIGLALLTGDRMLVPDTAWDLYANTGISHLLAISGTHVMLAALMTVWLLQQLVNYWPRVYLRWPVHQCKLPFICAIALLYGYLAGLSLPTLRTLVMVLLASFWSWYRHSVSPIQTLLRAFVLLVLWQPLSVHAMGFWLSFVAVAVLMLALHVQHASPVWHFVRLQWLLTWALLPLTLFLFGRIAWVSPLANVVAIPTMSFLVVPLELVGLALGAVTTVGQTLCWLTAAKIIGWLNSYLSYLAGLPFSQSFAILSLPSFFFLLAALGVLCLPASLVPRSAAGFFILPVLFSRSSMPPHSLSVHVIDVGQGLSVLIQTQHHFLLYDTGANTQAGEQVIVPYLRWVGVSRLNGLMISHNDKDHTGGANAVLAAYTPQQLWYSAAPEGYQVAHNQTQRYCQQGQSWQWDGIQFSVLSPQSTQTYKKDNDRSCVLKIAGDGFSVLLTGDIEQATEQVLVRQSTLDLRANLLVLGHHGSKTSSSLPFLQRVQPDIAVVSAGYLNPFQHPSPAVIARLQQAKVTIDSTIEQGTLRYHWQSQQKVHKEAWRLRGHYWLNAP
ncbi:DNA internalization-related competence protein ComEC/Rec2 [Agitococcus lubricus]|uniref:Competence protein ComEC n=1 Tax=Agitococcus lubricus TaxID=1077255 RepID=A0A2T5J202_9GAMM|nr:DNA internalization-related competence protein ComEC/Rec2 [Agitococcus lubricus]PTQ90373.1 competence protein ComEC [Agitococcus lubricus]